MAQPFDYSLNVPTPLEAGAQAFKLGAGIAAAEQEALAYKQAQQQKALEQQQAMEQERIRQDAFERALSPNATIEDHRRAAILGNPKQAEAFLSFATSMADDQKAAARSKSTRILYAAESGNKETFLRALDRERAANSDNPGALTYFDQLQSEYEKDPDYVLVALGGQVAELGGEKIVENIRKDAEELRNRKLFGSKEKYEAAKARSAEVEARYAEQLAKLSLREKEANIAAGLAQVQAARDGGVQVQSSQILPDGTSIIITKDGQSLVLDNQGNRLSGNARSDAISAASNFGTREQSARAGGRQGATIAQNIAKDSYESLNKAKSNISNIDEAISAIDRGAETGVIASKLPNVKTASIELANVRNRLGLDVVGATTFGSLTQGELNLALDTGLPTNLQPKDLRKWLVNKKAAQEKLANRLNEQVVFLSRPGATVGEWQEMINRKPSDKTAAQTSTQPGSVTVRTPDGKTLAFPNQQAADQFKRRAGL
jgi:hypothetical protein